MTTTTTPGTNPDDGVAAYVGLFLNAGMVTLGVGNNSWAGGDNNADGGLTFHLADTDVKIEGRTVVAKGALDSGIKKASR